MKILVTGASGFVGGEICELLRRSNLEVYATGRRGMRRDERVNYFAADITDAASLRKLLHIKKVDAVVHTAGLAHRFKNVGRDEFWAANVLGTKNVARLADELNAEHFVLLSSVAVYGKTKTENRSAAFEEDRRKCQPQGFYAASKYEAEQTARSVCSQGNMDLTILRLATVVGEGDCGNVRRLIRAIDENRFLMLGDGRNRKSLIYKSDAAAACRTILFESFERKKEARTSFERKKDAKIFNLTGEPLPLRSIVERIAVGLGRKPPRLFIPARGLRHILKRFERIEKVKQLSDTLEKWLSDEAFSNEKIKAAYDFRLATSVPEALGREVAFYLREKS